MKWTSRLFSDGLFSLSISSKYVSFWFRGQRRLTDDLHVIFCSVQRLVDPVHAAGHVTGVASDQHQVADWKEQSSGPEIREDKLESGFKNACFHSLLAESFP